SISPWQSSRYLMAKSEHVVIRSGAWACLGVLVVNGIVLFVAVIIRVCNQTVDPYSTVMIWAAKNLMPVMAGILLITGIVAAGISSASTFLSLIGFSTVNDIMGIKDAKKGLKISRITMLIISILVLIVSMFKPPMVWWMTQFSSSIVAAAWAVVAFSSVWWKRITKNGAFYGMLFGFLGSVTTRAYTLIAGVTLPVALDPFWVGIYCSIAGMVVGSLTSQITDVEKHELEKLHIIPEVEKNPEEMRKTKRMGYVLVAGGIILAVALIVFWAVPYNQSISA
ncbi:MAG: sodium:solute symporter family transporter, partial [Lacrimispora sphenoides]